MSDIKRKNTPDLSVGDELVLRVIDGMPAQRVKCVAAALEATGPCNDSNHCACHGGGPFWCCKCGAEFEVQ